MKILFQGDSTTDGEWNREDPLFLGYGYPTMVAGHLGLDSPGKHHFCNRGISGNKIADLESRWETDCINIEPDILSILIGVNDIWSNLDFPDNIDHQAFENRYRKILDETIKYLPKTKIVLMEPFVLPGTKSNAAGVERFQKELGITQNTVANLAKENSLPFITLQDKFTEACKMAEPAYWLYDGVHPTWAGHGLIAYNWLSFFREYVGA